MNLVDLGSISHGPKQGNFTRCKWHILPHYIPSIYIYSLPFLLAKTKNPLFECSFKCLFTYIIYLPELPSFFAK